MNLKLSCQFHPEFKSKPLEPHPLFSAFIKASYASGRSRRDSRVQEEVEIFPSAGACGKTLETSVWMHH